MAKSKHYIYSTLTAPQAYTVYKTGGANDVATVEDTININGGANVATTGNSLVTPRGVVTPVTSEQLDSLRQNQVFQMHVDNGFIVVSDSKEDPEVVAADQTGRDASAPLVPQDFEAEGTEAPKVGAPSDSDDEPAPKGRRRA